MEYFINMADNENVMEDDSTSQQRLSEENQIDLREISIILDGWSRTCDTVLNTLSDQITKVIKNKT